MTPPTTKRLIATVTELGDGGVETRLDGQELHPEYAIKNLETGQRMEEWRDVPREHIQEAIAKSHNPERYGIMVRWVTEWVVES